jgi:hypothetical protein
VHLNLGQLLFVNSSAAVLSSLIPSPGGIGPAEAALAAGLIAMGVDESTAFACAITQRSSWVYLTKHRERRTTLGPENNEACRTIARRTGTTRPACHAEGRGFECLQPPRIESPAHRQAGPPGKIKPPRISPQFQALVPEMTPMRGG